MPALSCPLGVQLCQSSLTPATFLIFGEAFDRKQARRTVVPAMISTSIIF